MNDSASDTLLPVQSPAAVVIRSALPYLPSPTLPVRSQRRRHAGSVGRRGAARGLSPKRSGADPLPDQALTGRTTVDSSAHPPVGSALQAIGDRLHRDRMPG